MICKKQILNDDSIFEFNHGKEWYNEIMWQFLLNCRKEVRTLIVFPSIFLWNVLNFGTSNINRLLLFINMINKTNKFTGWSGPCNCSNSFVLAVKINTYWKIFVIPILFFVSMFSRKFENSYKGIFIYVYLMCENSSIFKYI